MSDFVMAKQMSRTTLALACHFYFFPVYRLGLIHYHCLFLPVSGHYKKMCIFNPIFESAAAWELVIAAHRVSDKR